MPRAGSPAPPCRAVDEAAREVDLGALWARAPTLLFFYKADCGASEVAGPVLGRFAAIPGLEIAAVSQDGAAEARAFADACRWPPSVRSLLDPAPWPASEAFGVRATPTWVLVERGGRVAAAFEGWSRDDANGLAAHAAMLAGAPPAVVARPDGPEPALRPG